MSEHRVEKEDLASHLTVESILLEIRGWLFLINTEMRLQNKILKEIKEKLIDE